MKTGQPLVVNMACTGAIPVKEMTPFVPVSPDEVIADVAAAIELGVQMVHLHARDESEAQTSDPDRYGEMVAAIRALPGGRELVVCVTTSGRLETDFDSRARVLDLTGDAKPDMASLTLSSHNFARSASVNAPDTVRLLAGRMKERGIRPELEVFDLGMVNFIHVLAKEGLIEPPYYVNILLGNIAGAQVDVLQLGTLIAALPPDCMVSIGGLGQFQLSANGLGMLTADGVRVGIEDNIWFDWERTRLATNIDLIQRILAQASLFDRPLMARSALRQRLGLTPSQPAGRSRHGQ